VSPFGISLIVFVCVFGSAVLGLVVGSRLPVHHLSTDTKDVVKLATALIATMAALVLSLLISTAKGAFDKVDAELVENAARAISLDRALADYGPETKEIRDLLKRSFAARIEMLFPTGKSDPEHEDSPEAVVRSENIRTMLWALTPQTEAQRGLRAEAVGIAGAISATRWLLLLQQDESLHMVLLILLVGWLAVIFCTFGLFAPRNATVVAALFVCALSVSGAILLIIEMGNPFSGMMMVSSAPMLDALADLGR
jgi:hypothetical protein